ncbi:MAG: LEA type 2 family protein [Elusimicrobiaceae bacterium]|nr:LEA type 2 family protein [Elusimicrobiaceae bacterium]
MKKFKLFLFLTFSIIFACSCASVKNIQEQMVNCKYSLAGVATEDVSLTNLTLSVGVLITNNSKTTPAKVNRFQGKLYLNGQDIADIAFGALEVEPMQSQIGKAQVVVPFEKLGKNIAGLVATNSIALRYKIAGNIYFDTPLGQLPFPVAIEQQLK